MSEIKKIIVNGSDGQREYSLEDSKARQDVQEIVEGAPEELDSFREAFEAFKEGGEALADVNTAVEANAKAIAEEAERARVAEEKLAEDVNTAMAAVKAEKERAQGAEAAINDMVAAAAEAQAAALTQEVQRAQAAEKANVDAIVAEKMRAEAAELANANAIGNEVARATQAEADAVERGRQLALRALFVAAGAEYNGTDNIITKNAPWGESVEHLPNHYYLNGLGDITEEQMMDIYNGGKWWEQLEGFQLNNSRGRTNLVAPGPSSYIYGEYSLSQAFNDSKLEVLLLADKNRKVYVTKGSFIGQDSNSLKRVIGVLNIKNVTNCVINPAKLEDIELLLNNSSVSFKNCPNLKKESILNAITNATTSKAITITLHADAYARLANDADIVAALAAQPLVTLVSA